MVNAIPSVIFITFCALPIALHYFINRKYKKLLANLNLKDEDYYHQCLFIDMKNFKCKQHLINKDECCDHCSYNHLKTLINFISSAKLSICLCMYTLTLKQINVELIKAHKRGVNLRIITDQVMLRTETAKFNFAKLKDNGIPFKVQPSDHSMMHHKFCLIDKDDKSSAKMFFGTMNLTGQGLVSNFENVILTNNRNMIERFSQEFEELWGDF
ncbi:mitochondrial cardiolipin hydrolase-like [Anoplophora glabripennis]|uniref:mitochondrial cardiolipin hydrolase-like n=1 Tax=Anoplophora glabripennis TaxID=217634 RepID=UPI000873C335|nr:mitochondrial cardiolipin hydrolase-like [Anoplophora glabripennis]